MYFKRHWVYNAHHNLQLEIQMSEERKRSIRSYVLRQGRMTDSQKSSLSELYPKYQIPLQGQKIDFQQAFNSSTAKPTVVEIGFGMGQSLAQMAKDNPETQYIGIEVHAPGVGRLLHQLETEAITNVRVLHEDAVTILKEHIADHSLSGFQIFFPDPWPKKKHHKRRIIQPDFLRLLMTKLQPDGFIHIATDWQPYAEYIEEAVAEIPKLKSIADLNRYQQIVAARPDTRFENRGKRLGHEISDIVLMMSS